MPRPTSHVERGKARCPSLATAGKRGHGEPHSWKNGPRLQRWSKRGHLPGPREAEYPGRQRGTEEPRPGDPGKWCAPEVGGLIECTCIHDAGCEDRGLRAGEARQ
ncbi:hypothetical protein NDU88_001827 [Pleurodeles waltl]|uniref:Uncharacterized protein n=1 Tax=Pleurodeles waltl TaxID=8319 RepID=A0AAV7V9I8_PLEWA|nr:hypothetical protein NDU88_001827 [Pleurodeles waltl]